MGVRAALSLSLSLQLRSLPLGTSTLTKLVLNYYTPEDHSRARGHACLTGIQSLAQGRRKDLQDYSPSIRGLRDKRIHTLRSVYTASSEASLSYRGTPYLKQTKWISGLKLAKITECNCQIKEAHTLDFIIPGNLRGKAAWVWDCQEIEAHLECPKNFVVFEVTLLKEYNL